MRVYKLKERTEIFIGKFNSKYSGLFEYIEGYMNEQSVITCRCLKCGYEFSIKATTVKMSLRYMSCNTCVKAIYKANEPERIMNKKIKEDAKKRQHLIDMAERKRIRHKTNVENEKMVRENRLREKYKEPIECIECGGLFTRTCGDQYICSDTCKKKVQE